MSEKPARKPIHFLGSSKKAIQGLPEDVKDAFGSALLDAQYGDTPAGARPFGEGLPRSVMKLAEDDDGDTYRAAYTVAFPRAVYVLHVFQKKSKSGIATPEHDKNVIRTRLTYAEEHYAQVYGRPEKRDE